MSKMKKGSALLASGSLVLGGLAAMGSAPIEDPSCFDYEALGTGVDIREQMFEEQLGRTVAARGPYKNRTAQAYGQNQNSSVNPKNVEEGSGQGQGAAGSTAKSQSTSSTSSSSSSSKSNSSSTQKNPSEGACGEGTCG